MRVAFVSMRQRMRLCVPSLAVPTVPVAQVVDTTSAGDAFNAGFLAGWLHGTMPRDCCMAGNRLAGIVIRHKGAIIPKEYCRL